MGDTEKALADLDRAIEIDPQYAFAYLSRGAIYSRLENISQSKQDLEKLKFYFNDQEISDLSFAISLMNAFNRMAIAFQHG